MNSLTWWERTKAEFGFEVRGQRMRGLLHSLWRIWCLVFGCKPDSYQRTDNWRFCLRCWKRVP